MKKIEKGIEFKKSFMVTDDKTAKVIGSGDMPVLATPAMVAMMENTAMTAVSNFLDDGETTVGGMINTTHLCPSAVGAEISVTASLIASEGRKLTFHVVAADCGKVIGEGEHIRFVVDITRFMSKLM